MPVTLSQVLSRAASTWCSASDRASANFPPGRPGAHNQAVQGHPHAIKEAFPKWAAPSLANSGTMRPEEHSPAATAATNRVTIPLHSCAAAKRRTIEAWRLQVRLRLGAESQSREGRDRTHATRNGHVQEMVPGSCARGDDASSCPRLVPDGVLLCHGLRTRREGRNAP